LEEINLEKDKKRRGGKGMKEGIAQRKRKGRREKSSAKDVFWRGDGGKKKDWTEEVNQG